MQALQERLLEAHQRWRDLVQVLQKEASQATDPAVRGMALYRMGRVLVDRLGNVDEGVAALEKGCGKQP